MSDHEREGSGVTGADLVSVGVGAVHDGEDSRKIVAVDFVATTVFVTQ